MYIFARPETNRIFGSILTHACVCVRVCVWVFAYARGCTSRTHTRCVFMHDSQESDCESALVFAVVGESTRACARVNVHNNICPGVLLLLWRANRGLSIFHANPPHPLRVPPVNSAWGCVRAFVCKMYLRVGWFCGKCTLTHVLIVFVSIGSQHTCEWRKSRSTHTHHGRPPFMTGA